MNEAILKQVHDYLNGELSGTALTEFEAQMKSDPAFKAEVELHRDIDIALMGDDEIPFVHTLRDIHAKATIEENRDVKATAEAATPTTPNRRIFRFAVAAAAAILLAVFALPILFPSPDAMQISKNTIGSAPALEVRRSSEGTTETTKSLIAPYQKIKNGQYSEAIPELTKIYASTNADEAGLGLGYCHLQVKKYDNAIEVFEQIRAKKSDISDAATWYLAHSYLRKGDLQSTENILQKIIQSETVTLKRREQAKKLLNSL